MIIIESKIIIFSPCRFIVNIVYKWWNIATSFTRVSTTYHGRIDSTSASFIMSIEHAYSQGIEPLPSHVSKAYKSCEKTLDEPSFKTLLNLLNSPPPKTTSPNGYTCDQFA